MTSTDRWYRIMAFPLVLLGILLTLTSCAVVVGHPVGGGHMMPRAGRAATRCSAPAHLQGTVVHASLMDMGHRGMMGSGSPMMLRASPATVAVGGVTFVATNLGSRRHELVVLPLKNRQNFGQRASTTHGKVLERGALGEASRSCGPGAGDGLRPGTAGWVTLDLAAGRYELICNEPHHYQRGMYAELMVS